MNVGPELALGTVQFGVPYGIAGRAKPVPEREVRDILHRAAIAGIRRLDTAASYGGIEERLRSLVGDLNFEVVSKSPAIPEGADSQAARACVVRSVRRSYERLGPLLRGILFHRCEDLVAPYGAGILETATELGARLQIEIGISGYDPAAVLKLGRRFQVSMVQLPGNALDQRLAAKAHLPGNVELSVRSLFLQGLLLMPPTEAMRRVPAAAPALWRWHEWCRRRGMSPLCAALSVAKGFPGVRFCVIGVDGVAQFEEIASTWRDADSVEANDLATIEPAVIDPRSWIVQA